MNEHVQNEVQKAIAGELQKAFPDVPIYTGMDENERDEQFQGFAKLLFDDKHVSDLTE